MKNISSIALAPTKAITATDTSAAVDVSAFTGMGQLVLNASDVGGTASPTATVKITHCATSGGSYVDSGVTFVAQAAGAVNFQVLEVNLDRFLQFVKVVDTLTGTNPTHDYSVTLHGMKATA